jgi:hypothetical protein
LSYNAREKFMKSGVGFTACLEEEKAVLIE